MKYSRHWTRLQTEHTQTDHISLDTQRMKVKPEPLAKLLHRDLIWNIEEIKLADSQ